MAELAVSRWAQALGAYAGFFVLATQDAEQRRTVAAAGYPPELIDAWPTIAMSAPLPVSVAARTRQPVWLADRTAMAEAYPALSQVLAPDTQAQAAVPLVIGDSLAGVIGLSFDRPQPFDADDREHALTMAG